MSKNNWVISELRKTWSKTRYFRNQYSKGEEKEKYNLRELKKKQSNNPFVGDNEDSNSYAEFHSAWASGLVTSFFKNQILFVTDCIFHFKKKKGNDTRFDVENVAMNDKVLKSEFIIKTQHKRVHPLLQQNKLLGDLRKTW